MTRHGTRTGGSRRWVLVTTVGAAVVVLAAVVALIVHSGQSGTPAAAGGSPGDVQVEDSQSEPVSSGSPTPQASASAGPGRSPSPSTSAGTKTTPPGTGPTAGLKQYTDTYKVQQPYNLPLSARFSVTAGPTYNAWIVKGDAGYSAGTPTGPRTEMRWGSWSGVEHLWEADVLIDPGTAGAAIMQVKSNDGFEPVYVNVKNNGSLYNDSNKTVLAANMWGAWFHMVCGYDPVSGNGWVWINGRLAITRNDPHPIGTVWYFKNGVYNVTGDRAEAHFKNIRFWTR